MPHFWGCAPRGYDPKFELGQDFFYGAPTPKFHPPVFTHLEVIVLTNKQTLLKTFNALRYATTLGKSDGLHQYGPFTQHQFVTAGIERVNIINIMMCLSVVGDRRT